MSADLAASSVVLSNLAYLGGAILLMIVLTTIVVLRQRKPKSVEANVDSFNRGLRALAPGPPLGKGGRTRRAAPVKAVSRRPGEVDPG